jgi:hypothetical protein
MATKQTKTFSSRKITFGVRRKGKARKTRSPKDKPVKPYRAQGR